MIAEEDDPKRSAGRPSSSMAMIGNNIPVVFRGFLMFDFGDHFTKTDVGILTPLT